MKRFVWLLVILLLNMACTQPEVVETTPVVVETAVSTTAPTITPTILPTASPIPPTVVVSTSTPIPTTTPPEKVLTICQAQEPDSLYMYESSMLAAQHVRHAIYENLVTNLDFSYQAQGIEKLPSLADGDALLESVEVQVGDMVVDADGNVVPLAAGIAVRTVDGQRITADDSPRIMSQLSATFTLKPLVWSDGTAVSASDSVFSFEANRAANTFRNADKIARTAVYEATGDLTLRWVGLPGYLDQTYFLNVWSPLPRHQLGQYALDTLAALAEVRERPLSSGPFVITEWEPRRQITLSQNPYYYRTDEGLPKLDRVVYRFIPDSNELNAELLAGNCHVGTQDSTNMGQVPFLQQSNAQGLLTPHITSGTVWEHIDFGIDSAGAYGDGNGRPDWFEDVRVRQAMMMCTNRQQIVDEVLYGAAELTHAYVPDNHPLMPTDLQQWP
ncbi:MAG: hypothetical protein GY943_04555, partial [Chloroflexi bacterium]|nr:hypothetical protein [Chloroflexota bacterium]